MYFLIKDEIFLDKFNEVWEKVSNIIQKKIKIKNKNKKEHI